MIDPWELILHHSYTGKPGVIFDQSPNRKNHGRGVNLEPGDFHFDGAVPRSGAIAFRPGSAVRVAAAEKWSPLIGVRCEFVCRCDVSGGGGTLIDADSFSFGIHGGAPGFGFSDVSGGGGGGVGPVLSAGKAVPSHQWNSVEFYYNGPYGIRGTLNGADLFGFDDGWLEPALKPTQRISIGSRLDGSDTWTGWIDDVKVWRLDPHWVDNSFTNRPFDPSALACWKRWSDAFGEALKADPECAAHVARLMRETIDSILRRVMTGDPATREKWLAAAEDYQTRWAEGDLSGIATTLGNVISAIGSDLQLTTDPAIVALLNDDCLRRISAGLPSLDCDPQFTELLRKTMQSL